MKTYVDIKTSLEVISLLGLTFSCVLLGTFLEISSLLRVIISLVGVLCSTKKIYIQGTGIVDTCITATSIVKACTGGACTGSTYAESAYVTSIFSRATGIRDCCVENACMRDPGADKDARVKTLVPSIS